MVLITNIYLRKLTPSPLGEWLPDYNCFLNRGPRVFGDGGSGRSRSNSNSKSGNNDKYDLVTPEENPSTDQNSLLVNATFTTTAGSTAPTDETSPSADTPEAPESAPPAATLPASPTSLTSPQGDSSAASKERWDAVLAWFKKMWAQAPSKERATPPTTRARSAKRAQIY